MVAAARSPPGTIVSEDREQAAGRDGQHRDPRVREGQRQAAGAEHAERHGRRVAARPGAIPTTASPSPTSEPRTRKSRRYAEVATTAAADRHLLVRVQRERPRPGPGPGLPARRWPTRAGRRLTRSAIAGRPEGDREEQRQRHRRSTGRASAARDPPVAARAARARSRRRRPAGRHGQHRDRAAQPGDEARGHELLEGAGRAAEGHADQQGAAREQEQGRCRRAGCRGRSTRARPRAPRARTRPPGRAPDPGRRPRGRGCRSRPPRPPPRPRRRRPSRAATRPSGQGPVREGDPQQVGREHRPDHAGGQAERRRRRLGEERRRHHQTARARTTVRACGPRPPPRRRSTIASATPARTGFTRVMDGGASFG